METKKYTLPKKFAEKWVKALRSGEYKQGYSRLFNNGCFCVHGVAFAMSGVPLKSLQRALYAKDLLRKTGVDVSLFGVPDEIIESRLEDKLMVLNDKKKYTFPKIADWIEAKVEFI